jgi:hypothetical protein
MPAPVRESRLPVGSSASTIGGRLTSARAIATRCCWPPERRDGSEVSRPSRPTAASSSRARASLSKPTRYGSTGAITLSITVSAGSRLKRWKTKPTRRRWAASSRRESPPSSLPATVTVPSSGRSSAPIRCSSVDLPEPDGPDTATAAPGAISSDTPSSAAIACSPSTR